jgi:Tfp pilus assembly protein PilZ
MNQAIAIDRRTSVRTRKSMEVEYSANCQWIKARLDDLSEDGAFIDTQHGMSEGSELALRFSLSDGRTEAQEVRCKARVVWREPRIGIGVELVDLDEATREQIRLFVASQLFGW